MHITRFSVFTLAAASVIWFTGCQIPKESPPSMTTYVQIRKIDHRYWFVRGNERFLSLGVDVVAAQDQTQAKDGRRYNVLPKYHNDVAAWARDAEARLKSWNFTTVAAWSHEYLYEHTPMYHTRVVWFGPWGQNDSRLIDVFSESYAQDIEKTAREQVAPQATNEYLIGYFVNNELPWYGERGWPTSPNISLLSRYMELPETAAGKSQAVEFLRTFYSNRIDELKAEWEVDADSFDELKAARQILPIVYPSRKAVIAWSGVVAEQYYKLCAEAIRRHDSNHLILGSRFAERAYEPVMKACGKYADAISVNHYRKTGIFDTNQVGAIFALTGKPVMITEFSWRAMENSSGCPNSKGADVTVATQEDRTRAFRSYSGAVLSQPYMLGYDWFMYHDQPPTGRFDGEDCNYGLVDIYDRPYSNLLAAITEINGQANAIHEQSSVPLPAYDPLVLADYREISVRGIEKPLPHPIVFADAESPTFIWGDLAQGASIEVEPTDQSSLRLDVKPGSGWGCGITFNPLSALASNPDGSANLLGATQVVVEILAPDGVRMAVGLNESGNGPIESQTFRGFGFADGESYATAPATLTNGWNQTIFRLQVMETSTGYGNQRGNKVVDLDALASIHLFFPSGQKPFVAELKSIRVE